MQAWLRRQGFRQRMAPARRRGQAAVVNITMPGRKRGLARQLARERLERLQALEVPRVLVPGSPTPQAEFHHWLLCRLRRIHPSRGGAWLPGIAPDCSPGAVAAKEPRG